MQVIQLNQELFRRHAEGDLLATEQILKEAQPSLRRLARKVAVGLPVTSSLTSDDLQQEGAIGVMRGLRRFDPERETDFEAFAMRCAHGAMIDAIRSHRSSDQFIQSEMDVPARHSSLEPDFWQHTLRDLNPTERQVIEWYFQENLSMRVITERLGGIGPVAGNRILNQALQIMRARLS